MARGVGPILKPRLPSGVVDAHKTDTLLVQTMPQIDWSIRGYPATSSLKFGEIEGERLWDKRGRA